MSADTIINGSRVAEEQGELIERGSGNVFADLGFADAQEMQLKARLAARIVSTIEARGWAQAAEAVGLKQPDISNLRRARLGLFSIERLLRILLRLGHTVQVQVSDNTSDEARLLVQA